MKKAIKILARRFGVYSLIKPFWNAYKFAIDSLLFKLHHPSASVLFLPTGRSPSQYGQDRYIYETFFSGTSDGLFIDIGANHPIQVNNSLYFEQRGWRGVAVDPVRRHQESWRALRPNTTFLNLAVAETRGWRSFTEIIGDEPWHGMLSGFTNCVREEDMLLDHETYDVMCAPLTEVVPKGAEVDLLSLDVEGAEALVLAGIGPLGGLRPKVILCENIGQLGGRRELRDLLAAKGYRLHERIWANDDVFEREGP